MTINKNLGIAVVNGGSSAEAEVSRISARGVIAALEENYEQVYNLELNTGIAKALADCRAEVVFPVVHGPPGEDGTLQGFLEIMGLPYVGSDVHASSAAMDKIIAKHIFRERDLPLARQVVVHRKQGVPTAVEHIGKQLGHQVVVKPARQGSALGVSLTSNANQLHEAVEAAFYLDEHLLIEQRITGKEITVGVLDTDTGSEPFPVIEIITPENTWYDYKHRYTQGLSEHIMPAALSPEQTQRLKAIAVAAHEALGCRDLSRADFVVPDDTEEVLLEVNTMPGMTPTSLYPEGAGGYGLSFAELVSYLIERAYNRTS
ncbi:MAG: D-alanine--D-alanine ligase [Pseudomonadales bacterium]